MYTCPTCTSPNQDSEISCWYCYSITCLACRQSHGTEWLLHTRSIAPILIAQAQATWTPQKLENDLGEYEYTVSSGNGDTAHYDCCGQRGESEFYGDEDEKCAPIWMREMALRLVIVDLHWDLDYIEEHDEVWEEDLSSMLWDEGGYDVEFPVI